MKDSSWIFGSMTFHACSCQFSLQFVIGSSPEMKIIFLSGEAVLARTNRRYLLKCYDIYFMPEISRFPAADFSKLSLYHEPSALSHPRMGCNNIWMQKKEHEAYSFYFTKKISFKIMIIIINFILLRGFHSLSFFKGD